MGVHDPEEGVVPMILYYSADYAPNPEEVIDDVSLMLSKDYIRPGLWSHARRLELILEERDAPQQVKDASW